MTNIERRATPAHKGEKGAPKGAPARTTIIRRARPPKGAPVRDFIAHLATLKETLFIKHKTSQNQIGPDVIKKILIHHN